MNHVIVALIPGLALCCFLGLFVFGRARGHRDRTIRSFGLYLMVMALWSLGALMIRLDGAETGPWRQLVFLTATGSLLSLLLFTRAFTGIEKPRWLPWLVGIAYLLIAVPLGFQSTSIPYLSGLSRRPASFELGPLVYMTGIYWIVTYAIILGHLLAALHRAPDPVTGNRIHYPLIGLGASFVGTLAGLVPALSVYSLDLTGNLLNASLLAYALAHYHLFDLRLVIRRSLALALVGIVAGAVYLLSLTVALSLTDTTWLGVPVVMTAMTLLLMVVAPGLRENAQLIIDRLFFRKRYDSWRMLRELSAASVTLRPLDELAIMLLQGVTGWMGICSSAFLVRESEDGELQMLAQTGHASSLQGLRLRADHPLVQYLSQGEQVISRNRMRLIPQFEELRSDEKVDLARLAGEVFVGVPDTNTLLGLFVFGPKRDGTPYTADDYNMLATLANQTAVSIANARLYRQVRLHAHELEQANAELRQLDRMKDEFIQTVSHELRTPLTFVRGYVDLLTEGAFGPVSQTQANALEPITRGIDNVVGLVNDIIILTKSADELLERSPVDLGKIAIACSIRAQATAMQAGVRLMVEAPEALPQVMGDGRRLTQVFDNLIANAIKFSPDGGAITISIVAEDDHIHCQVSDSGIGIPADQLDQIWERFYQVERNTQRRFGGTGLGLHIVKRIVNAHNGTVWAESAPGEGSTFHICLPLAKSGEKTLDAKNGMETLNV